MRYAWDPAKARRNLAKHGVSFEEALDVFDDPLFLVYADPLHSEDECRYIILGCSAKGRLLVVSYSEMNDTLRLISARLATRREKENYAEEN